MKINRSVIPVLLLMLCGSTVVAESPKRVEDEIWTEYIYAADAASRAAALQKLQKRIAIERLVATLKDFKANPNAKQDMATDLAELAQALRTVAFNLTDFPEAMTLAQLRGSPPPAKEDYELLHRDLELCRKLLTGISVLADIRAPGTQINLKGNDAPQIQGCAMESARLARAVYFLGIAKRDISYMNLGREVWLQCWNTLSDETRKSVLKLPAEENPREANVEDAFKAYLELLNEKYRDPKAKAAVTENIPGALSPEEIEKREKQIAQLKSRMSEFYDFWNKGDAKSLEAILAKECKNREALISTASEKSVNYEVDDQTRIDAGASDNANPTLFISRVQVKVSGKDPSEFRSLHVLRFNQIEGLWRIVEFER